MGHRTHAGVAAKIIGSLGVLVAAGCGPGGAAEKVRPKDPTAAGALDEGGTGTCHQIEKRGEPLVVDWKPEQRADLEEAMHDGVAIASYTCQGIKLMKDCRLEGNYGFLGMTKREQVVRLENSDEVRANLPTLGGGIAAKVGGELARGSVIDVAMVTVGKRRTTWAEPTMDDLKGSCDGATHFVHGAIIGAFVMETGTKAQVRAAVEILGAGASGQSDSSKNVRNQEGDPKDCATSSPDALKPPAQCGAAVRLEMLAIGPGTGKKGDKPDAKAAPATPPPPPKDAVAVAEEPCPQGLVYTAGKCTAPANAPSFLCEPANFQQCDEQCKKGNNGSCGALGALFAEGRGTARDAAKAGTLFKQACDAGDVPSCVNLGRLTQAGNGVGKDAAAAAKLFERGCNDGDAAGCGLLGSALAGGDGVTKDETKAAALLSKGCEGGFHDACGELGVMLVEGRGVTADKKKAADVFLRACNGGLAASCNHLGEIKESNGDTIAGGIFYQRGCMHGESNSCTNLGRLEMSGKFSTPAQAKMHFERSCNNRDSLACAVLKVAFGDSSRPVFLDVPMQQRLMTSCNTGSARDCAASGVLDIAMNNASMGKPKLQRSCTMGDAWGCALQKSVH